jgi:hypothetical protein
LFRTTRTGRAVRCELLSTVLMSARYIELPLPAPARFTQSVGARERFPLPHLDFGKPAEQKAACFERRGLGEPFGASSYRLYSCQHGQAPAPSCHCLRPLASLSPLALVNGSPFPTSTSVSPPFALRLWIDWTVQTSRSDASLKRAEKEKKSAQQRRSRRTACARSLHSVRWRS